MSKKPKFEQAIKVSIGGDLKGQFVAGHDIKQVSAKTTHELIKAEVEELHSLLDI